MFDIFIFFLFSCSLAGVFAGDAVKLVTEGESVTLEIDVNTDNEIQWIFGHNILIALVNRENGMSTVFNDLLDGRFRDRLELDHQTGSLTITDTRTTDSGLYEVIGSSTQMHLNTFNLTVYARLSVPVISLSSQNASSSEQSCSLLCSAVNVSDVSDVSVSWYRGHSLLSSISVSNLSISLSLRLEIECPYDSYSCVINNSISNQTNLLNSAELCQPCADNSVYLISAAAAAGSLLIVAFGIFCIYRKHRKTDKEVQTRSEEITYADPTFYKRKAQKPRVQEEDEVVYAGVAMRR